MFLARVGVPLERDLKAHVARVPMSPDDLSRDAREFQRTVLGRNRTEMFAGLDAPGSR